jgi:hypothetical protein
LPGQVDGPAVVLELVDQFEGIPVR